MKTKIKQAHTPTPWEIVENKYGIEICGAGDSDGQVWQVYRRDIDVIRGRDIADAKFIILAVNAYEENQRKIKKMLSVLHEALAHSQLLGSGETPFVSNSEMCEIIGEVIALCEGEENDK